MAATWHWGLISAYFKRARIKIHFLKCMHWLIRTILNQILEEQKELFIKEHHANILIRLIVMMFDNDSCFTGVNLSLLSRVMSSRLSRGTYNGGLLSTEAGTLARVIADATITLAGYGGVSRLLNVTLLPSFFICVGSIIATCYTYNSLYWLGP